MANSDSLESKHIARLKHFLRMGHETTCYQPGTKLISHDKEALRFIREMLDEQHGEEVIQIATQFHGERVGTRTDTVPFVLAACAHNTSDKKAKVAAYAAIPNLCLLPQELFAYVHYSELLTKAWSDSSGWGRGHRKEVSNWYNSKEPMELARMVTKCVSGYKWTHRDIFKLVHLKPANKGVEVVAKFIMKGWDKTREEFKTDNCTPDIEKLLTYLNAVHDVKHSKDNHEVARLVEKYDLSLNHVPTTHYRVKEIWTALVPRVSLEELLQHLPKLAHHGYLRMKSDIAQLVKDRLQKECKNSELRLHPMDVYLAKMKYEESGKSLTGRPAKNKPISIITETLKELLLKSAENIPPSNKRFLIAVDVRNQMAHSKIPGCSQLTPNIATALLIWGLWHSEPQGNVKVVAFGDTGMTSIDLKSQMQFEELITRMKETPIGNEPVHCSTPIIWAKEQSIATDVFIVCTDKHTQVANATPPSKALEDYRTTMKQHAKLVACAMAAKTFTLASPDDPDMLNVAGFDHFVPKIIHHFAKS